MAQRVSNSLFVRLNPHLRHTIYAVIPDVSTSSYRSPSLFGALMQTFSAMKHTLLILVFSLSAACSAKSVVEGEANDEPQAVALDGAQAADGEVDAEALAPASPSPAEGDEQAVALDADATHAPEAHVQVDANTAANDDGEDVSSDPEFASGSFAISDDSGELEMLLGLRDIPPFRIEDLLTADDLRETLGIRAPQERGSLTGATPSPYYNHLRYTTEDKEQLGVTLQYWHFKSTRAATTHFQLLKDSTAGEAKPVGLASESFYADFEGVTQLVSVDYELEAVLAIACQVDGCHVPQLMQWMRTAIQRLNN